MTPDMQAVLERLEKLERQIRRLKGATVLVLTALGAAALMGEGRPTDTVEARRFVVIDSGGVKRAELSDAALQFFDSPGHVAATLFTNGLIIGDAKTSTPSGITLHRIQLDTSGLAITDGKVTIHLGGVSEEGLKTRPPENPSPSPVIGLYDGKSWAELSLKGGPSLTVSDTPGFKATLGATSLVTPATGETHNTPAASFVLFGKDAKVL